MKKNEPEERLVPKHAGAGFEEADEESFATPEDWIKHLRATPKRLRNVTVESNGKHWTLRIDRSDIRRQWAERHAPGLGRDLRLLFMEQRKALAQLVRTSKSKSSNAKHPRGRREKTHRECVLAAHAKFPELTPKELAARCTCDVTVARKALKEAETRD